MKQDRTVLMIEDEVKISQVVVSYLETKDFQVLTATNGKDAFEVFNSNPISLVLLDLMLPDISGEEICIQLRKKSRVPIIMLTAKVEEESLLKGLDIGADDYITKPFSLKALHARIEAVLRRSSESAGPLFNKLEFNNGDLIIDIEGHIVLKNGENAEVTAHEFQILSALVSYPQKVFTREELIEIAFGIDYDGYDRTIDSHIKNIRGKIEDNSRKPKYISTVHGVGYKFGGD